MNYSSKTGSRGLFRFLNIIVFFVFLTNATTILAQQLGGITGRYTDSNGSAMGTAMIALYDSNRRMITSTFSSSNGNFTFSGIQPGTYFLQFSKNGAPDVWHGGGNGQPITVGNSNVTINFQRVL